MGKRVPKNATFFGQKLSKSAQKRDFGPIFFSEIEYGQFKKS